ncbi:unnamed protein product [Camellia sinensis]
MEFSKVGKLVRDFLWEGCDEDKKDHLVKWEVVSLPREKGGLAIGNIVARNIGLLSKWLEVFDGVEFDKWVDKAMAPPIESSLKLYEEVLKLGFKVFLLTRHSEQQSGVIVANLINSGFQDWDKLILRATKDHGKLATIYKSKKRNEMVEEGY